MPSDTPPITEYERGYLDGVAAASAKVATFFQSQKEQDARILREMGDGQAMMHKVMLNVLTPLQDEVRHLKPENANAR